MSHIKYARKTLEQEIYIYTTTDMLRCKSGGKATHVKASD